MNAIQRHKNSAIQVLRFFMDIPPDLCKIQIAKVYFYKLLHCIIYHTSYKLFLQVNFHIFLFILIILLFYKSRLCQIQHLDCAIHYKKALSCYHISVSLWSCQRDAVPHLLFTHYNRRCDPVPAGCNVYCFFSLFKITDAGAENVMISSSRNIYRHAFTDALVVRHFTEYAAVRTQNASTAQTIIGL